MSAHTDTDESRALWGGNWIAITAVIITVVGCAFTYGMTSENIAASVATLEKRADSQSQKSDANAARLDADERAIAVVQSQLADIKDDLDEIKQDVRPGAR